MRTRKDYELLINEGTELFFGSQTHMTNAILGIQLQVLLDIKEIVEGLDRRMGAQNIIKKAKKKKN